MNAAQRRIYRRAIDRAFPPGLEVYHIDMGDVVYRVRKRSVFERDEYPCVPVERVVNPFGHNMVHPSKLYVLKGGAA